MDKMERLTHERVSGIKTGYWSPAKKEDLVQRLAAYEDTGLTPEEITDMRRLLFTVAGMRPSDLTAVEYWLQKQKNG